MVKAQRLWVTWHQDDCAGGKWTTGLRTGPRIPFSEEQEESTVCLLSFEVPQSLSSSASCQEGLQTPGRQKAAQSAELGAPRCMKTEGGVPAAVLRSDKANTLTARKRQELRFSLSLL